MKYVFGTLMILMLSACGEAPSFKYIDLDDTPTPDEIVAQVENLQLINTSQTAVTLRWQDDHQAAGYIVRRDGEAIATIEKGLFTFTDSNLIANKEYQYEIVAVNDLGRESVAASLTITTLDNSTAVIHTQITQLIIADSTLVGTEVLQVEATDSDNHGLTYQIKTLMSEFDLNQFLTIDDNGLIRVKTSLNEISGKVFNLQVEVSDGLSLSSMSFKLGIIATQSQANQQGLSRNVYQHSSISDDLNVLKQLEMFPDSPSSSSIESVFQSPSNVGSHYGQRMLGYLIPPTTGEYQFWIAADDSAELSLSTDSEFNNLQIIAGVPSWTNPEQWDRHGAQSSEIINLIAGKAYAIQALMVEGGGGDHLAVAWQGPGFAQGIIANEYLRLPIDFESPTAVTDLHWLKTADNAVTLQWKAAHDNLAVDHYEVFNGSEKIATTEELTIGLTGLLSATRYDFSIRSVDGAGNRSLSSQLVSVVIDDFIAPTVATSVSASSVSHDAISLTWQASSDERNKDVLYRLYFDDEKIGQTYATDFSIRSLNAGTEYSIQVEAVDEAGNASDLTTAIKITTSEIPAATPVFLYSNYQFILPVDGIADQHFGQLDYQIHGNYSGSQTVQLSIVSGDENNYFSILNSGELSLLKPFSVNTNQSFSLEVEARLENQFTRIPVTVFAVETENFVQKGALQQVWTGLSGSGIENINTQGPIASQQVLTDFKSPTSMGNNYGQKVSAYLTVPKDGEYNFWIASDDASELRISSDMTEEKAQLIARVNGYTGEDNWSNGSQVQTQISLNAGQYYYLEVLHKEGGGGDHMSVAWQGPDLPKALLSNQYILPISSFKTAPMQMETAFQTNFEQLGNQIQLDLLVSELNAGRPVIIYYGEMDAGQTSIGWQYNLRVEDLIAGQHSLVLENINPGSRYYIRVETLGPLGSQGSENSSWSENVLVVDAVLIDETKILGETLPETIQLSVLIDEVEQNIELVRHSVRSPNFQLLTFDSRRVQQYQSMVPTPEIRTYRGTVTNNDFVTVTGVVDSKGIIHLSAWGGDSRQWGQTVDIKHLINSDALGNTEFETAELKLDITMPDPVDNRYYLPQPGNDFHNNLSRVAFTFRNTQFMNQAEGNLINAIAQMEGHINELDYVWAQKTGLRWDIGNAVIEENGAIEEATQARPAAVDSTTFRMTFQDPRNGGYCWGGGDWLGCVANYTMNWGFTHEVGHNFGLGHGEQTDNNNQIQQPSTHMGNMQARKTTARLQKNSKFRPAAALTNPMLPATFKDYLTVYQDQTGSINPLLNDFDANGEVLNIDSFDEVTLEGGNITRTGNTLTYTPPVGFVGVDQFSYVATDGQYKTRGPVQIQVLTTGLTAHWDMDSLTTDADDVEWVSDLSGQGNHLSAPNLTSITPAVILADVQVLGQDNQGMSIPLMASAEKANDALGHSLLPHKLDPGHKSFSAAMWFKYSNIEGNKHLIGKSASGANNMQYGGWEIRSEGNKLEMQVSFRDRLMQTNWALIEQEAALTDGSWHHVAMVIDRENGELKGYLDGAALTTVSLPEGQGPITAAMNSSGYGGGSPFRVGGHAGVDCVDGANEGDAQVCTVRDGQSFDSVKLYHKALTEAEVLALFNE